MCLFFCLIVLPGRFSSVLQNHRHVKRLIVQYVLDNPRITFYSMLVVDTFCLDIFAHYLSSKCLSRPNDIQ